ncbi:hypothetical protein QTP86_001433 [Hemibagrus guttatus]|nr:hypothetical protein QTP86_001433 [Hemibagrus guttatus]
MPLSSAVSINSVTGEIYSMQSFNFEEMKTFQFHVQATDSGVPPLSNNVTVNVFILDENDSSPVFLPPYSEPGSVNTENIPYSAEAGYFVAKVRAVDADSGYNALLSYYITESKGTNLFRIGTSTGEIRTKRRMSDNDLKTHPLIITVSDNGEPSLSTTMSIEVVVVENMDSLQPSLRQVPVKEENFSNLNLYLLIAIVSVSVIFLLSLIALIAAKCYGTDGGFSRSSAPVVTTHPDGSWSYSKSTQQYDVCFSSDTLKSDVVVFPSPFPPADAELISINGGDTFNRTQTLPSTTKVLVEVVDVNDNAPDIKLSSLLDNVREDAKKGTVIALITVQDKDGENSPAGALIASVSAQDMDIGENAQITYSLLRNSNMPLSSAVSINSVTGEIYSMQSFNFEEMKTFQFHVQATDSGVPPLSNNVSVNVFILDENDSSPVFLPPYSEPGSVNTENIPYSAEAGYFVAKVRAVDADSGYNALLSYHITESKGTNLFRIGTSTGEIRTKRRMSDNDLKTHPLIITVSDNGEPSLSTTMSIEVVVVENVDSLQPSLRQVPVKEENFSNLNLYLLIAIVSVSVIFLLSLIALIAAKCYGTDGGFSRSSAPVVTTHPDGSWSYSKSTQQYDVCFSSDTLKSDVVVFPSPFPPADAELISINGGDTFNSTQTLPNTTKVLVEVVDVNDNAPDIKLSSLLDNVREDAKKGTVIALITVQDKDGGKNGKVRCFISQDSPFVLESTQGKYYSLVLNSALDREENALYNVSITATDEGVPPLSSTTVLTVHISDVNDNAPRFPESSESVYVKENSPAGALIASVSAQDMDFGENAQITYSLLRNSNMPLSSAVSINSVTGEIYSMQSFNFEEMKTFQFHVQATDSGVPPLSNNVSVNVFILDENDNSPVFLPPYSEPGSVNTENIPYSAEAGYFVAKVRAVDADSGYNALLSYYITESKGTNLFRIGTSTGEIRTKRRMSDNDLKTHPLIITVSDNGEPSLSTTMSIEVVVVENMDSLQPSLRQVPVKEENFSNLNLYLLIAIVSVSVIFLLSLIALIAAKCYGTDGGFSRSSAPVVTTHPDGSWSYSKSTQQYDVCFSSDTLKSDVVVFPSPFPPADAELISINGGDTFNRTQTLPDTTKVGDFLTHLLYFRFALK